MNEPLELDLINDVYEEDIDDDRHFDETLIEKRSHKMKYYIILFKDGALNVFLRKPIKDHFQKDARFFEVPEHTRIDQISEWIAGQYKSSFFKEIEGL